jgi:hypothetical protein
MCFFRFLWIYFESLGRCDSVSTCVRDSIIQDELSPEHQAEVTLSLLSMSLLIACLLFVGIVVIENVSSLTVGLCAV